MEQIHKEAIQSTISVMENLRIADADLVEDVAKFISKYGKCPLEKIEELKIEVENYWQFPRGRTKNWELEPLLGLALASLDKYKVKELITDCL